MARKIYHQLHPPKRTFTKEEIQQALIEWERKQRLTNRLFEYFSQFFFLCVALTGLFVYCYIWASILFDVPTPWDGEYPWKNNKIEWSAWLNAISPELTKILSQDKRAKILSQHNEPVFISDCLKVPIVIVRDFQWPDKEMDEELGEGPWLITRGGNTYSPSRKTVKEGFFADLPSKVKSVVWLSLKTSEQVYSEYRIMPENLPPVKWERRLVARIIDLETRKLIGKNSWDCSYALGANSYPDLDNRLSLERAWEEMIGWLESLRKCEREKIDGG